MSAVTSESNARFVRELRDSLPSVELVAAWLRSRGQTLRVNPITIRPTIEEWSKHSDSGDITLLDPERRIEVTHRKLNFTCRQDFPLHALNIEKVSKYERRVPKPYAYIALNKPMTHAAIVLCERRAEWIVETWDDPCLVSGQQYPVYACLKTHLLFTGIVVPREPELQFSPYDEFGF